MILTEGDTLSEHVDVYSDEWRQARWKEQIETGHPSTDDSTLLQALLSELTVS